MRRDDPAPAPRSFTASRARGPARSWMRAAILLPLATVLVFGALTAVSILEIRSRGDSRTKFPSVEDVSAKVVDRYRSESRELGSLREKERARLRVLDLFAFLDANPQTRAVPDATAVLAKLKTMTSRDPEAAPDAVRHALSRLASEIEHGRGAARECEIIERILVQAALAAGGAVSLDLSQRKAARAVLDWSAARGTSGFHAVLHILTRSATDEEACLLWDLAITLEDPQLRRAVEVAVSAIETRRGPPVEGGPHGG